MCQYATTIRMNIKNNTKSNKFYQKKKTKKNKNNFLFLYISFFLFHMFKVVNVLEVTV